VKAKYRDLKTKKTWFGRGRMALWLKSKQTKLPGHATHKSGVQRRRQTVVAFAMEGGGQQSQSSRDLGGQQ
jgi:hypothetical protein